MTKKTKKYTLTAQDIQAYLCELGIKPTKEVSIYSIEYYFDKQTVSTDKLSVEKLQEQLNTAKKALTESEKMYQKQMDRFLNSEMNESARSHCESQLKLLFLAHKAYEALAAIGNEGSGDE
ncbi:hypothetical protein [Lactococcus lactis]|uniref:hypothetical protein n=1 Tax=Lactococcus lactis TaxID=1358 RepID=UPI00398268F5